MTYDHIPIHQPEFEVTKKGSTVVVLLANGYPDNKKARDTHENDVVGIAVISGHI